MADQSPRLGLVVISYFGIFYSHLHHRQVQKSSFTAEYTIFRDLLRELRTRKGLTQVELSEALEMPQSFVSKYEAGERRLDMVEVRAVCKALETTLPSFVKQFESKLIKPSKGGVA